MTWNLQPNKALHRTAIPPRFIAAGELDRWAVIIAGNRWTL
jgi:hypothetical protein